MSGHVTFQFRLGRTVDEALARLAARGAVSKASLVRKAVVELLRVSTLCTPAQIQRFAAVEEKP